MGPRTFEGTWEDVSLRHASELTGRRVRITVLDAPPCLDPAFDSDIPRIVKIAEHFLEKAGQFLEKIPSFSVLRWFSLFWIVFGGVIAANEFSRGRSYTDSAFIVMYQLVGVFGLMASESDRRLERRLSAIEKRQAK